MKKINFKAGFAPLIIMAVIVVALAAGGGVYYFSKNKSNNKTNVETEVTAKTETEASSDASVKADVKAEVKADTGTLRTLLALGKDLTCTFTGSNTAGNVKGSMYLSGTMMRGDFTTTISSGSSVDSHMLKTGDSAMYVWSGSQGAKMDISKMTPAGNTSSTQAQGQTAMNLDQKVDYKCDPWVKDVSKFGVPTGINFIDLEAMMKQNANVKIPTGY